MQKIATSVHGLTSREIEILTLCAHGKSAPQIGRSLGITKRTADAHRAAAIRKLRASNVTQAVAIAISAGFIQLDRDDCKAQQCNCYLVVGAFPC